MGTILYSFLSESIFFQEDNLKNNFADFSEDKLKYALTDYRDFCIKNLEELKSEIKKFDSSLKVFSNINFDNVDKLKQCALYLSQFVINDPLFEYTEIFSEQQKVFSKGIGIERSNLINRQSLVECLRFLKNLTPMVVDDYIKIFPISLRFEAPEIIPLTIPDLDLKSIPEGIIDFFNNNLEIHSLTQESRSWIFLEKLDYTPGLFLNFKDTGDKKGAIQFYQEMEVLDMNDNTREVKFLMKLAKYPMEKLIWENWVNQSIVKLYKETLNNTSIEVAMSTEFNASYLCKNNFISKLLQQDIKVEESIQSYTISSLFDLNLPFLEKIDVRKLMEIRKNDDVFTNFRMELEKNFRELRNILDPYELKLKQENFIHEIYDVQISKLNSQYNSLKKKIGINSGIVLGGLAATSLTSGFSLLGLLLAGFNGYKSYMDYIDSIKQNPSFLLWKAKTK